MRAAVALIIMVFAACAVLASHQRKPFELRIDGAGDAKPGTWPRNAALAEPDAMMCRPMIITVGPGRPKPIVRT